MPKSKESCGRKIAKRKQLEMTAKTPTYKRTSADQIHFYRRYVKKYPELEETRRSALNWQQLLDLWTDLALKLNALRGPKRSAIKWRQCFSHWKNQRFSRIRKAQAQQSTAATDDGVWRLERAFEVAAASAAANLESQGVPCAAATATSAKEGVVIKEEVDDLDNILNNMSSQSSDKPPASPARLPTTATQSTQSSSVNPASCEEMCQKVLTMLTERDERDRKFQQDCMRLQQTMAEALHKVGDGLLAISQLGKDVLQLSRSVNLSNGAKK